MFLDFFVNKENNEPRFAYGQARINPEISHKLQLNKYVYVDNFVP
jgi:hypothetical protein